ncbi:microcystin-dependent protein [Comamonas odontotermitis]|uniref:Microcystin-dependent protein n=1 Tax=Comamonas odontotermitis TaxID=379895 RepID=A0ABR6RAL2_9BURK|nr:tail fiber protein [Comamonas odontotermitis]MBB6576084.1 microcystin-dependent protein [Comamonas odontotermitis]
MSEPYIGEIQIFGFNFAPRGWAFCNGAIMPIQQNTALFALLGTQYGGNGQTTYQLPDLMNRAACSQGQGPGLTPRTIGETFGSSTVTLLQQEMPNHTHTLQFFNQGDPAKRLSTPQANAALNLPSQAASKFFAPAGGMTALAPTALQPAGGSQPHENRQPYLALNFCIALQGVFPSFG